MTRFAENAANLASLAARGLGWRPAEFWNATPAELALSLGASGEGQAPPTRDEISAMIAKDRNDG